MYFSNRRKFREFGWTFWYYEKRTYLDIASDRIPSRHANIYFRVMRRFPLTRAIFLFTFRPNSRRNNILTRIERASIANITYGMRSRRIEQWIIRKSDIRFTNDRKKSVTMYCLHRFLIYHSTLICLPCRRENSQRDKRHYISCFLLICCKRIYGIS